MSKKILWIALVVVGLASLLPSFVILYGMLFGHAYTNNQFNAATILFLAGIFEAILAAFVWSDI